MEKKYLYMAALFAGAVATGCSEADKNVMWEKTYASVCFEPDSIQDIDGLLTHKDSILTFSFSLQSFEMTEYTVSLPVMVTGMPADYDRQFSLRPDEAGSTAVAGTHYEPLRSSYTMPAGKVCIIVPVKVYRTEDMQDDYKELRLLATGSEDFTSPVIEEKSALRLRISDRLEQPEWWARWQAKGWFGKYSRKKYQQWINLYGPASLGEAPGTGNYAMGAPDIAYYHNLLREYFIEHPDVDEDGDTIEVPVLR